VATIKNHFFFFIQLMPLGGRAMRGSASFRPIDCMVGGKDAVCWYTTTPAMPNKGSFGWLSLHK